MKCKALILLIFALFLSACDANAAPATEPNLQIGNPWKSYDSMTEAIEICGLAFPLPEIVGDYTADSYRVMNGSLLEVTYRNGETEITVRMQAGDDPDISGVYETFQQIETTNQKGTSITRKQAENCLVYLVCHDGHSFSIYAASLTADGACQELLSYIC